ncbi:MAG: hypothetical protein JST43_11170 [Bacteroidetes bacterium]|nr:hypothetical protein [Bacteroidota bacterium]MBS1540056.1 hypothetical protein [Bacteroidota bacterium]
MFLLVPVLCFSQSVIIKNVELAGDNVIVNYDLEHSNPASEFLLNLYASNDNFSAPLKKVTGDVGQEIKAGTNKKMIWAIRDEWGNYKGKVALEIRGKVFVPFIKLQNFITAAAKYKRGKNYDLLWRAGNSDPINIELYKGNTRIQGSMQQPNNGAFTLFIPVNAKSDDDYRLKISDSRNAEEILYTPYFKVVPKVPFLVKAIIPLTIGGGAVILLGGGKKESSPGGSTTNDLPLPGFPK